jgi:hypothetical protein
MHSLQRCDIDDEKDSYSWQHLRVDPVKLAKAKLLLDVATDTEAVDRALTLVVSEGEIDETMRRIGGKGNLKKVFRNHSR